MTGDMVNGLFEVGGACFLLLNVRALWRDRSLQGVHWAPVVFFQLWGLFNLWFYPAHGLLWSFIGGVAIVAVNTAWLLLLAWIVLAPKLRACPEGCDCIRHYGVID